MMDRFKFYSILLIVMFWNPPVGIADGIADGIDGITGAPCIPPTP
jgi:hypothetical protein